MRESANKMVIIRGERSKEFLREFNSNVVDKEFIKSCRKAGELFSKKENNEEKRH